jgi:hypothetical protein
MNSIPWLRYFYKAYCQKHQGKNGFKFFKTKVLKIIEKGKLTTARRIPVRPPFIYMSCKMKSISNTNLSINPIAMRLNGVLTDLQIVGDLLIPASFADEDGDLFF